MEFTQNEVLAMLEESGRTNWNIRQMTKLRSEGLLPKLTSKRQPRTNKPLNVWDETDIDLIVDVYDLLEYYGGSHEMTSLVLWLEGYSFSLDLLRKRFLRPIENYLQRLTQGETDPDEISIAVSSIALMLINKFLFTPGLSAQRKKMSKKQISLLTQIILDILSDQEPDEMMIRSLFLENADLTPSPTEQVYEDEIFERDQRMLGIVRDILSFPHMREAIITATLEQWEQVRNDYLSFCHVLSVIEERRPRDEEEALPEDFLMGLKITGAMWLTAPLLSVRCHGYGQWIDLAFEKMHEFLADPVIQERILNKYRARKAIEADVENRGKPELPLSE